MRKIILLSLLLAPVLCFSQTIDSVSVTIGNPTSTVYVKGIKPYMDLSHLTIAALNDMNNTQVISLYFKGCPLNQIALPYDTLISISVPFPFALEINTLHDTSTVCSYPSAPFIVDTFYLNAVQILSLEELSGKEENLTIYPNPTNNSIDISAKSIVEAVSIYSMEGKKLSDKVIEKSQFNMDLADLSSGDYFLVFKTKSKELITKRITKK
ncbi:T9SS type A sorting domain-containing protein [Fluviicola sp.]|uniref:T9SS type A sorting domain-containing protein n=1 Tax=Fluviicola sp. TaxID=1917219 RepID=UPI0031E48E84